MFLQLFRKLGARLKEQSAARKLERGTLCGKQGADGEPPEANLHLSKPDLTVVASHSGPDTGVAVYKQFTPDLQVSWEDPLDWAYGISVSMYDLGPTGRRNGEPVADCFGILAYPEGAVLAVADGVNWGEPPRRAARCAVLGCLNHMHHALKQHEGDSSLDSHTVFRHLVDSISAAQKLILQQFGTLTTLVVSVVLPLKWVRSPGRWAAITLTVGDSAAYVYRAASRTVEEVTAAAHADGARDPRWCPGALGYAMGEEPDLANMMLCLTFLDEGDFIFLTSDGVADNFDPVIRKIARHQVLESTDNDLPALSPAECQAKAMDLLREVLVDADRRLSAGASRTPTSSKSTHGSSTPATSTPATPTAGDNASSSEPAAAADGGDRGTAAAGCNHCHVGLGRGSRSGGMTARGLAEQLLQHVYEVTTEQRQHVEARSRERERERGLSRGEGPCLSTDGKHGGLMGLAPSARPPGKMDHATVAAYQVGRRKPNEVARSRARLEKLRQQQQQEGAQLLPFLAAQAASQQPPGRQTSPQTTFTTTSAGSGSGSARSSGSGAGSGVAPGPAGGQAPVGPVGSVPASGPPPHLAPGGVAVPVTVTVTDTGKEKAVGGEEGGKAAAGEEKGGATVGVCSFDSPVA